jgi:hypothetical protein
VRETRHSHLAFSYAHLLRETTDLWKGRGDLSEEDYDSMLEKIDGFPRNVQYGCRKPSLGEVLFETRTWGSADMSF